MLTSTLKKGLLFGSIGIVLAVVAVLVTLTLIWRVDVSAAKLLPAEDTVAFFSHMSAEEVKAYGTWYPPLLHINLPANPFSLALLREDNDLVWVIFEEDPTSAEKVVRIQTSLPNAEEKLREQPSPLSSFEPFVMLKSRLGPTSGWAYIDLDTVQPSERLALDRLLSTTMTQAHYAMFTSENTMRSMALYAPDLHMEGSASREIPLPPNPVSVFSIGAPARALSGLITSLPETEQTIAQGFLNGFVTTLFGKDVSLTFDLEPLLEESGILYRGESVASTDAPVPFAYVGSVADYKSLPRLLQTLVTAKKNSSPKVSIQRHEFDQGFSAVVAESAPGDTAIEESSFQGWVVWAVEGSGKQNLYTAHKGKNFWIANDRALLEYLIGRKEGTIAELSPEFTLTLPQTPDEYPGALRAGGRVKVDELRSLIGRIPVLPMESALFPAFSASSAEAIWTVEQEGSVVRLNVWLVQ